MKKINILELTSADKTHEELCASLAHIGGALKVAAHDYADGALKSSELAFDIVANSGPVIELWQYILDHDKYAQRALFCMQAARSANEMALKLEETLEVDIDSANADWKESILEEDTMNALLVVARTRIQTCHAAIPAGATPRSRCKYKRQDSGDGTNAE